MIVVTGASGFVGSALCLELSRRKIDFRPVSRSEKGFVSVGEIDGTTDWRPVLQDASAVIHLAARVHVMKDNAVDPLAAFRRVNVDGTVNFAKQAAMAGVKRFIYLSSIKVNGEATEPGRPFTTEDPPSPKDPYSVSKCEAENLLFALGSSLGMEVVVIRPPLVYGPGVKANFRTMMALVQRRIPLPLALIENFRSLIYVENLADLIICCLKNDRAAGKVFLGGDGTTLSTPQLLKIIARSMDVNACLFPVPVSLLKFATTLLGKKDVAQRLLGSLEVDITATKQYLNWTPPIAIDEAMKRTTSAFLGHRL